MVNVPDAEKRVDGLRYTEYLFSMVLAYLIIKQNIRKELIQINDMVGFENFNIYNGRKSVFRNYGKMIESAVYGSVEGGEYKIS